MPELGGSPRHQRIVAVGIRLASVDKGEARALGKTPEQIAAKEEQKRQQRIYQAWQAFWASPAGQARRSFYYGDQVLQFSIDVLNQAGWVGAMAGNRTRAHAVDPTAILNSVCREGWELVNGDFVFLTTGHSSRDKLLSSGQQVAVAGTVLGYYLFRRCEANLQAGGDDDLQQRIEQEALSM